MRILSLLILFGPTAFVIFAVWSAMGPRHPRSLSYELTVSLDTGAGLLPFGLDLEQRDGVWTSELVIGDSERIEVFADDVAVTLPTAENKDTVIVIRFPHYDSVLTLAGDPASEMTGRWSKVRSESEHAEMSAIAKPASTYPFDRRKATQSNPADFTGRWSVKFSSSEDLAVGVFTVAEDHTATGTFMTTTGDYRYLSGQVDGDLLRLSTFDGAHAFLFHAQMQEDGSLTGDFWSGNWWHETWTATRDPDAELPDAFAQTSLNENIDLSELTFTDLKGTQRRLTDVLNEQGGKARIVEIFGTWCPNCADAATEIARLKAKHGDQLGVVALAFEITDDHARSVRQIERYKQRHQLEGAIDWPILIAGVSDKAEATQSLRVLDRVRSYPTTLFLNEANEVIAIHTGFSGPATGEAFINQQARWEAIVEELLAD